MSSKNEYTNKILKILAEKTATSFDNLYVKYYPSINQSQKYALNRSIKNLIDADCIEILNSDNKKYLKLTKKGKNKLNNLKLEAEQTLVSNNWDGLWRIIILDLPEKRKKEREALRYLLKKANFSCIKNTVWVSPYPYENLFMNIKKDMGLGNELMIIVTDKFYK